MKVTVERRQKVLVRWNGLHTITKLHWMMYTGNGAALVVGWGIVYTARDVRKQCGRHAGVMRLRAWLAA